MIRLHEIELGVSSTPASNTLYQTLLGLHPTIEQNGLTVFYSGNDGIDFNLSNHLPPATTVISFLTDNLGLVLQRLNAMNVKFEGPKDSHLGMRMIEFTDPDGHRIRINEPSPTSPIWLKV